MNSNYYGLLRILYAHDIVLQNNINNRMGYLK